MNYSKRKAIVLPDCTPLITLFTYLVYYILYFLSQPYDWDGTLITSDSIRVRPPPSIVMTKMCDQHKCNLWGGAKPFKVTLSPPK